MTKDWHYHLQWVENDAQFPLMDVVYPDVFTVVQDFLGIAQKVEGRGFDVTDIEDYSLNCVSQLIESTDKGEVIGVYCNIGEFILRMYNCPVCTGSSRN